VVPGTSSKGRSKEHHHAVGLGFLEAFQSGDLDACTAMLHPDVEWHPSAKLADDEVLRGRNRVRHYLEALHDRFEDGPEVTPDDGRQIGEHVLLISVLKGKNAFNGTPVKSRQCWVVSIRDDLWSRIVCYPNAPVARLGFEAMVNAANPSYEPVGAVTLAAEMENAPATPAELAQVEIPSGDGGATSQITLTFTFEEAEALSRLQGDGSGLGKIRSAVEQLQAIAAIRKELEQAGIPTKHLSDQQVAQLGQRISQAAPRLGG
jgi:ketosteroid isomerase-like protein